MPLEFREYQQFCLETEATRGCGWERRVLHAAIGCACEGAEFLDEVKKREFYGKQIDEVNVLEELGDQLYYIAIALDAMGITLDDVKAANIRKLQHRYNGKFTQEAALNRDLEGERKVLESER